MIHQDDLQFWLLEHKESKSGLMTDYALIGKIKSNAQRLHDASRQMLDSNLTPQEAVEIALKLSVDAFILAENIKP